MKSRELKNQFPQKRNLITVSPEASLEEALKQMREGNVHHLLVMKEKRLLGIVSSHDILVTSQRTETDGFGASRKTLVFEAMRTNIPTITEDTEINTALSVMVRHGATGLPLQRKGEVVGIVTETDMLKVLDMAVEKSHRLSNIAAAGETALAHPLTQNFIKALCDAGL